MGTTENIVEFLRLRGIEPEVDARDTIEFPAVVNSAYTRGVIGPNINGNVDIFLIEGSRQSKERWSLYLRNVKPENCVDRLRDLLDFAGNFRI